jgi:predicted DNA-binding transcriptional regulator AlpA
MNSPAEKQGDFDLPEIWNLDQTAQYTQLSKQTLRNKRSVGEGPRSFRLGGSLRYYRADVLRWVEEERASDQRWGDVQ